LDGDTLYVADFDNGLYHYSLSQEEYIGFYPAHRGTAAQGFEPKLVLSPDNVIPLHHPVAVAISPSGKIMVQEHISGRVAILQTQSLQPGSSPSYLPLILKGN
jgi:hypothetical protein